MLRNKWHHLTEIARIDLGTVISKYLLFSGTLHSCNTPVYQYPYECLHPANGCSCRPQDRKSTRLNSSHVSISYAVFCLKNKTILQTFKVQSAKDGCCAVCSGGDQRIRGRCGYQYVSRVTRESVDAARAGRLQIPEVTGL